MKVIVVGLDGFEPSIAGPMLDRGELPHLAGLRDRGGFARVATTSPAQTPVAWSTFATGVNPGGHGIFDFIRRDPKTYLPDLALNRYEQKNAFMPPKAVNLRRGTPVWDLLGAAGVGSTVLRCPCTFPPDPLRGRMLSGMGVPDLRGGLGTSTFYSTADGLAPREAENVVQLNPDADGTIRTHLIGPRNPKDRTDLRFEIALTPDLAARTATLRSAGTPKDLVLREGVWSDWLAVKFKLGMLQTVRGSVRFLLVQVGPTFELYASPINFDPEQPPFPISAPAEFAREIAGAVGPYYTTGMVEDHAGLSNERFGESAFLDQCAQVWDEREAMMLHALERFDEGLFYCLYDTPDRAQHMLWRFREPDHPANRGRAVGSEYAGAIEEQYRRGDAAVGSALEFAGADDLVIVLSDHGFGSFRRGVHLNTWLHDQGLLTLRPGLEPGEEAGDLLRAIDWDRTKAYALGLGGIYLNMTGREERGIVAPGDAEALARSICDGLDGLMDAERGATAIRSARPREALYHGAFAAESPDLVVHFAAGYRASWGTSMGGLGAGTFEDNTKKWAGDHIVDPALVPGCLFMSRPFRAGGASLVDLAPTILDALGVPRGPIMEGSSLLP